MDLLGLFDGFLTLFSAARSGAEINDDDEKKPDHSIAMTAKEKEQIIAQRKSMARDTRKPHDKSLDMER